MISIIVAIDSKNGIGKNNDLLFHIPEDFKRMHQIISGHPLVMGRKTFESIGRVLPENTSIIITRGDYQFPTFVKTEEEKAKCMVVHSLEEALRQAQGKKGSEEIFIFGGGQIFKEALEKNLVDRLYLTVVEGDYGADTFFPDYSNFTKVISEEDHQSNGYKFKFIDLEK
jgi:dihydrofolate reductase